MIQSIEKGRKEDGNRSIADKIIKRLHDLDKTVETNLGRWAWELLQNAKDSIADSDLGQVSVQIELNHDNVEFRHNGKHFTERDIRGLINQISSKEVEDGEQTRKTGRFGTGFLTTHLLSRVIRVKGIVETESNEFYNFNFSLDRDGKTTNQLIPKIENAWSEFHASARKINNDYNKEAFNTSFSYNLAGREQQEIARLGINEFTKLIPYVLAFLSSIESVKIIDNVTNSTIDYTTSSVPLDEQITTILKNENGFPHQVYILTTTNEYITLAAEIQNINGIYSAVNLNGIPKLFCDFPLIGTEKFHFPVVVNSFFFHPQTERDGIWLKGLEDQEVIENKDLLEQAATLYQKLLNKISHKNFCNLFNLVETRLPEMNERYFDEKWYKDKIQTPLREFLWQVKLVELEDEKLDRKTIAEIWFPFKSYSSENREKIWKFNFDLYPESVCKKVHLHYWCDLSWEKWNRLSYAEIVKDVKELGTISKLSEALNMSDLDSYDWLNSFCNFLLEDESNLSLMENNAIIPNQNGVFKKNSELRIDRIQDNDLIRILKLVGEDWNDILVNENVDFGKYQIKEKKDIAIAITEKMKRPAYRDDNFIEAISLLSEWLENHQQDGEKFFSEIFKMRAELFMNTIEDKDSLYRVMRSKANLAQLSKVAEAIEENPLIFDNIRSVEELTLLMKEFKINDVTELRQRLSQTQKEYEPIKNPITKEVLASLGVTSEEELEDALRDKNIAANFTHTSSPTIEMFVYAQRLIERAKVNVVNFLRTHPEYDCSEIQEVAKTVYGGIKKDGCLIHVVVRPSDNGEVIVYYNSEKDTLDYANSELWIDNAIEDPIHLTLGKILKTTGINRIPV